jgi:pimeloyl-ACP methyl ester carboxylesterase
VPVFDLQIPGKPEYSVMDWFSRLGYDNWCFDCEGYGKSDKKRNINADVATGADDIAAVMDYMARQGVQKAMLYGSSSGALRAGMYAQRIPSAWRASRSMPLPIRRRQPNAQGPGQEPAEVQGVQPASDRPRHGALDLHPRRPWRRSRSAVVEAFADAVLAMDNSMPTGTYVDMVEKLPLVDPRSSSADADHARPVGRHRHDRGRDELLRQAAQPGQAAHHHAGAHTSMRSKNYERAYHVLDTFFARPALAYTVETARSR